MDCVWNTGTVRNSYDAKVTSRRAASCEERLTRTRLDVARVTVAKTGTAATRRKIREG
jgi:hypothetical protein